MLKFTAISIAALAATSAFAQAPDAATAVSPSPAAQTGSAAAAAQPATTAGAATPDSTAAPQATTADAAPAASTTNAQVAAVVEAGFPKYDVNKDGKLSQAEFKQWISDLKTQEIAASGKPADPAAVAQYASAALAAADRDKDGVVTKQDLTTFLGG